MGGQYFKNRGLDEETMWRDYKTMTSTAEKRYGAEFPEIIALMEELIIEAKNATYHAN